MLLKLKIKRYKWQVINNAKKLKHTQNEVDKCRSIIKDMTKKEREHHKIKINELKEKINYGERGWFIRNNNTLMKSEAHSAYGTNPFLKLTKKNPK